MIEADRIRERALLDTIDRITRQAKDELEPHIKELVELRARYPIDPIVVQVQQMQDVIGRDPTVLDRIIAHGAYQAKHGAHE